MKSTRSEIIDWLRGYKYGATFLDKFILLIFILNGIVVLLSLYGILGREKTGKIAMSNPMLLNWIPVKQVSVKMDGTLLSLPLLIDYVALVKLDWEQEEKEFLKRLQHSDGVILDIGSNIGYYTAMLAREHPHSRIISVEASPTIFKILESNCRRNKLSNITLYNKAITDKDDDEIDFFKRDSMSTIDKQILEDWSVPDNHIKREKTRTITIDSVLASEKVDKVLLLKIDIEGAEVMSLNGAQNALEQKMIQNMMIEYHTYSNRDHITNLLKKLGYQVSVNERQILYENKDHANGHIFGVLSK